MFYTCKKTNNHTALYIKLFGISLTLTLTLHYSEVVGWFIDSIEIVRQDCNALLNEWKVSSNMITAWSNHLNNIEMQKDRSENDLIRYFFGFDFMVSFSN